MPAVLAVAGLPLPSLERPARALAVAGDRGRSTPPQTTARHTLTRTPVRARAAAPSARSNGCADANGPPHRQEGHGRHRPDGIRDAVVVGADPDARLGRWPVRRRATGAAQKAAPEVERSWGSPPSGGELGRGQWTVRCRVLSSLAWSTIVIV